VPRQLTPEQLDSIAMQMFVHDAAETAAAEAGLRLRPAPIEWDGGTMGVRTGAHAVVLATAGGMVALTIAHGRADDVTWRSQATAEIARGHARIADANPRAPPRSDDRRGAG
jgi:hypothetical protein